MGYSLPSLTHTLTFKSFDFLIMLPENKKLIPLFIKIIKKLIAIENDQQSSEIKLVYKDITTIISSITIVCYSKDQADDLRVSFKDSKIVRFTDMHSFLNVDVTNINKYVYFDEFPCIPLHEYFQLCLPSIRVPDMGNSVITEKSLVELFSYESLFNQYLKPV
jgi:hypothetical protein